MPQSFVFFSLVCCQLIHIWISSVIKIFTSRSIVKTFTENFNYLSLLFLARYVVYILTVQGSKATSILVYEIFHNKRDLDTHLFSKVNRNRFIIYFVAAAVVYLNDNKLYAEDLPLVLIAYLIVKYPETVGSMYFCNMLCILFNSWMWWRIKNTECVR